MEKETTYLLALGILIVLVVSVLVYTFSGLGDERVVNQTSNEIKQFSSYSELEQFINKTRTNNYNYYGRGFGGDVMLSATSSAELTGGQGKSADDYSQTNIQVEGVDEPDIVKNDGKYIYVVVGNKVEIVEAYPTSGMKIVGEIKLNKSINNIFLNKNKLVILMNDYSYVPYETAKMSSLCFDCGGGYSKSKTGILVYDVSDKINPELKYNFSVDGYYTDARMIDNYIYLVSNKQVYGEVYPTYSIDGTESRAGLSNAYYFH